MTTAASSVMVNRFSRNCTNLTNPAKLINLACFVVSWFRGFAFLRNLYCGIRFTKGVYGI